MRGFVNSTSLLVVSIILNIVLAALVGYLYFFQIQVYSPLGTKSRTDDLPLTVYAYGNLKSKKFEPKSITFGKVVTDDEKFVSQMFYFDAEGKKVSGLMNYPKEKGPFPLIIMFRGFVDESIYEPGVGTKRVGEELAKSGYVTLAPDFLGYGESDEPAIEALEDRFQTYTTALALFSQIKSINEDLADSNIDLSVDLDKIGIWAHSNGGQIALTVLEVTGEDYPAVLWAPVTKPFPYSIFYFTDEYEDEGRGLRRLVYEFEKDYDIQQYSLTNYLDWIKAPIQLHQGGADDAVPQEWSEEFVYLLEQNDIEVEYFVYPGADHNLAPDWSEAVERTKEFYEEKLWY